MSPVPQGMAELIAHIFQPSCGTFLILVQCVPRTGVLATFHAVLPDSEVVSGTLRARQKSRHRAQGENSKCNLSRGSSKETTRFPLICTVLGLLRIRQK